MKNLKYVLFDLDGTLLDTREGVLGAILNTIERCNREIPSPEILESLIGPPIQKSFQKLYNLSNEKAMEMANLFRDIYKTDDFLFRAIPYAGIYEVLEVALRKGMKIGVATYKREDYARRLLSQKGFDDLVSYVRGSDVAGNLSKADIIRNCLDDMGGDISQAVYIGDSISDGVASREVAMDFIAVTYGFGFKQSDETMIFNPIASVSDCHQIKSVLTNI